jgi:hypothetical protein
MEELQALVSQKALTAAYEELRDTPAKLLPAWAYEEMLRRAGTRLSARDKITRAVFPPSTPLVDLVRTFPPYLHGVVQQGLRAVFAEW